MARPHLVGDIFVPDARVDDDIVLHAAWNFIQYVTLRGIFCQVVAEFIFSNLEKDYLFLLHWYTNNAWFDKKI